MNSSVLKRDHRNLIWISISIPVHEKDGGKNTRKLARIASMYKHNFLSHGPLNNLVVNVSQSRFLERPRDVQIRDAVVSEIVRNIVIGHVDNEADMILEDKLLILD